MSFYKHVVANVHHHVIVDKFSVTVFKRFVVVILQQRQSIGDNSCCRQLLSLVAFGEDFLAFDFVTNGIISCNVNWLNE